MLFAKNHIYMKLLEFAVVVREGDRGRRVKRGGREGNSAQGVVSYDALHNL